MKRIHIFMKRRGSMLVLGAFLPLLLQGCATNVDVKCGPGSTGGMIQNGVGLCNSYPIGSNYTGKASPNFYNTATGQLYTGGGNCASGKRCNPNTPPGYGRCADGTSCKNWVTPSTMICKCDCNP